MAPAGTAGDAPVSVGATGFEPATFRPHPTTSQGHASLRVPCVQSSPEMDAPDKSDVEVGTKAVPRGCRGSRSQADLLLAPCS
jgi:hypothetical protein